MIPFLALLNLRKVFGATRRAKTRRPAERRIVRMESLEDRTVPTIWSVGPSTFQSYMCNSSVHTGDVIEFAPGTYSQQIVYKGNNGVTLQGQPGAIIAPTAVTTLALNGTNVGGAGIDIYGSNVVVEGLTVTGADDTDGNMWAGIRVIDGGSATIENNTVEDITSAVGATADGDVGIQVGDALVSGKAGGGTAIVENNTVTTYAGAGVIVDGGYSNATVTGNTITGRGTANGGLNEYGVQVSDGASARVQGNTIGGNTVYGCSGAPNNPTPTSAGIFVVDVSKETVVALNTLTGNDDGVLVESSTGECGNAIQVVNNSITGNYGYAGVFVLSSSNVEVAANCIANNLTYNGVALNYSSNVFVGSNDISYTGNGPSQSDGIYDYVGCNNQIYANNSFDNSGNGINIQSCNGDQVFNDVTTGNALNGINDLGGTNDAIWLGGEVVNAQNGIMLSDTSGDTIVGNAVLANGQWGIYIESSTNTFVAANLVSGNHSGSIFVDSASAKTTTLIANWTSTPPVKDGTSGATGCSNAFNNASCEADSAISSSGLCY